MAEADNNLERLLIKTTITRRLIKQWQQQKLKQHQLKIIITTITTLTRSAIRKNLEDNCTIRNKTIAHFYVLIIIIIIIIKMNYKSFYTLVLLL